MNQTCKILMSVLAILVAGEIAVSQESSTPEPHVNSPGIVETKPEEGRFVELDDGRFMVPYSAVLPGTTIQYQMVPVPGGTFVMGDDEVKDQSPSFKVKVEPFWIGKYEVTWEQYQRYMTMNVVLKQFRKKGLRIVTEDNKIDAVSAPSALYDPNYTYEAGEGAETPAATIRQHGAKQFTKWLSLSTNRFYRLPFEAEWEYACRAGSNTKWHFGDDETDLKKYGWYSSDEEEWLDRNETGKLKPNEWGIFDMHGNVSEWVLDAYNPEGYVHMKTRTPAFGDAFSVYETFNSPQEEYGRVLRGGDFQDEPEKCTSRSRKASSKEWLATDPNYPKSPWWFLDEGGLGAGFRLIRPLKQPDRETCETFWKPNKLTAKNVREQIEWSGRGARGLVDDQLHKDIEKHNIKTKDND